MIKTREPFAIALVLLTGCASRDWSPAGTVGDPDARVAVPSSAGVTVLTQRPSTSAGATDEGATPPSQHHHHGAAGSSSGAPPTVEHGH